MEAGRFSLTDGVVVLEPFRADDEDAHLAGEDEEQARRFGWWPKRSGPEQFRAMLAADEEQWRLGGPRRRLAVRVGGELVGGCEAHVRAATFATLSYWTFPPYRRRGYASRAARLLAEWVLAELGADRVEVHVEDDNVGSRAVARAAGFSRTGRRTSGGPLVYERLG